MAPKSKEKSKTSNSQPPPAIEDLFTSLHQHIKDTKYEEAVKVADQGFHNSHLPSFLVDFPFGENLNP
jgi:protein-arginine kinase activator protein McsA